MVVTVERKVVVERVVEKVVVERVVEVTAVAEKGATAAQMEADRMLAAPPPDMR